MAHPDDGLFIDKKKWAIKWRKDMEELWMPITKWRSQSEKATYCMIPTIWYSGKSRTMMTVKWSVLPANILNWQPQHPSKIPIQPGYSPINYLSIMCQSLQDKI